MSPSRLLPALAGAGSRRTHWREGARGTMQIAILPEISAIFVLVFARVGTLVMLMPGIGVMSWKEAQARIGWGTVVLFGVGISLGQCLLTTKAANWMAGYVGSAFGLQTMTALAIIAVLALFLIVIHLGFASATGRSTA